VNVTIKVAQPKSKILIIFLLIIIYTFLVMLAIFLVYAYFSDDYSQYVRSVLPLRFVNLVDILSADIITQK